MKDNKYKEKVFKDIREALIDKSDADTSANHAAVTSDNTGGEDLSVLFAERFTQAGGTLYYCGDESEIRTRIAEIQQHHGNVTIGCASDNLTGFINHLNIGNCCTCEPSKIYPLGAILCEALIAWQGSVVISSNLGLGTTTPALFENTIVLAFTSQVVSDWEAANERLKQLYPNYPAQIMVTHPASLAYRKKQQRLFLILIEDEAN